MSGVVRRWPALMLLASTVLGCAPQQADRRFRAGDYAAAIELYEAYLVRRGELSADDAPRLLRLALAYGDAGSGRHDPSQAAHYLTMLVNLFPGSEQALTARRLLAAAATDAELRRLETELAERDRQLATLEAVLRSVAADGRRLRDEAEGEQEVRADLESRVQTLTREAQRLSDEIAALEGELEALKQIDLEAVGADPPG